MTVSKQQALDNAYAILIKRAKVIIKGEKAKPLSTDIKTSTPKIKLTT